MKPALIMAMATILLVTISCNNKPNTEALPPASENKSGPHKGEVGINESQMIQISNDQGQTVPNARVLLGDQEPAGNSWITTNEEGQFIIPSSWTTAKDLTVEAPGFVRLTLKDQMPKPMNITLRKMSQLPTLALKGTVSGITTKDRDGYIDFATLLNSMTKSDVLNFSINKVISPWTEKISAAGFEIPVPQNIFVPKQKESYIISLTLQKPSFNLFYDSFGKKSLYSLQGRFPLKKIMSEIQNKKPFYELINHFDFSAAGQITFNFFNQTAIPDIDTVKIKLDKNYAMKAPKMINNQVALGISAFKENDTYQPLDIKYMKSEESVIFKSIATTTPHFIGVVKNASEFVGDTAHAERMSISIDMPAAGFIHLPLINQPTWVSTTNLQIDLPDVAVNEFADQGMVVIVSEMQNLTLPNGKITKYKIPIWEIHTNQWASHLAIPNIDTLNSTPKRVEVTLLAKKIDNSGQQNPLTLISTHEERVESSTHLTKSARDY